MRISKKTLLILAIIPVVLLPTIATALTQIVLSNISEGQISAVKLPQQIEISAVGPEEATIAAPFYLNFTVTNPNPMLVLAKLYVNFTLSGTTATFKSMTYLPEGNTFEYAGATGPFSYITKISGEVWTFKTPGSGTGFYIKIPSGTNTYQMQFQVNVQCLSITYKAWFTFE